MEYDNECALNFLAVDQLWDSGTHVTHVTGDLVTQEFHTN